MYASKPPPPPPSAKPPPHLQGRSAGPPPPPLQGRSAGPPPPHLQGRSVGPPPPHLQGRSAGPPPPPLQGRSAGPPPPPPVGLKPTTEKNRSYPRRETLVQTALSPRPHEEEQRDEKYIKCVPPQSTLDRKMKKSVPEQPMLKKKPIQVVPHKDGLKSELKPQNIPVTSPKLSQSSESPKSYRQQAIHRHESLERQCSQPAKVKPSLSFKMDKPHNPPPPPSQFNKPTSNLVDKHCHSSNFSDKGPPPLAKSKPPTLPDCHPVRDTPLSYAASKPPLRSPIMKQPPPPPPIGTIPAPPRSNTMKSSTSVVSSNTASQMPQNKTIYQATCKDEKGNSTVNNPILLSEFTSSGDFPKVARIMEGSYKTENVNLKQGQQLVILQVKQQKFLKLKDEMTQKETQVMHNCAHKFALIFEDDHTLRTTDWESEFDDVEEIFNLKRLPQVMRVTKAIVDHNRKNIPKGTILVDIEKCKKAKKIVPRKQAHLEASGLDGTRYKFYPNERVFFDSRRQATAMFAAEIIKSIQLPVRIQAFVDEKKQDNKVRDLGIYQVLECYQETKATINTDVHQQGIYGSNNIREIPISVPIKVILSTGPSPNSITKRELPPIPFQENNDYQAGSDSDGEDYESMYDPPTEISWDQGKVNEKFYSAQPFKMSSSKAPPGRNPSITGMHMTTTMNIPSPKPQASMASSTPYPSATISTSYRDAWKPTKNRTVQPQPFYEPPQYVNLDDLAISCRKSQRPLDMEHMPLRVKAPPVRPPKSQYGGKSFGLLIPSKNKKEDSDSDTSYEAEDTYEDTSNVH